MTRRIKKHKRVETPIESFRKRQIIESIKSGQSAVKIVREFNISYAQLREIKEYSNNIPSKGSSNQDLFSKGGDVRDKSSPSFIKPLPSVTIVRPRSAIIGQSSFINSSAVSKGKPFSFNPIDEAVYEWYQKATINEKSSITGLAIRDRALRFAKVFDDQRFTADAKWLNGFLKQRKICLSKPTVPPPTSPSTRSQKKKNSSSRSNGNDNFDSYAR